MFETDVIYYFHWTNPLFPTDNFERWSKWEFYGKPTVEAFDNVTKRNLKLFHHHSYPQDRLHIIRKILEHLNFTFIAQFHDRVIYSYSDHQDDDDVSEFASRASDRHAFAPARVESIYDGSSYPMSPASQFFIQDLVLDLVDQATTISTCKQRSKIITFKENFYAGAYFVRENDLLFINGQLWRWHCKSYRTALFWKRYYNKHYPHEVVHVHRALYKFVENDIIPGGHWINELDGSSYVDRHFLSKPSRNYPRRS